jgi:hypothetical protein
MRRFIVMFNNNKYFKDDCVLSLSYKWSHLHSAGTEEERRQELIEANSCCTPNEARIFNSISSITSALGAGGLARSRGDFAILEVFIVPGLPVI